MKTDRELLVLAAKAAGLQIVGLVDSMIAQPDHRAGGYVVRNDKGGDSCWNPLTDDGDALRLAVKLDIGISPDTEVSEVCAVFMIGNTCHIIVEEHSSDPYAATRRAIVRAAAEIGEASK